LMPVSRIACGSAITIALEPTAGSCALTKPRFDRGARVGFLRGRHAGP
jgi:hypothetical protein